MQAWTTRHEEYQEALEATLESVLGSAGVDATLALQALVAPPPAASEAATPMPARAELPLRAFVDYPSFERMMKDPAAVLGK